MKDRIKELAKRILAYNKVGIPIEESDYLELAKLSLALIQETENNSL